jgi:hypothetical protein
MMTDQAWAVVAGVLAMVALRLADYFLPRGRMSKWARDHSVKADDDGDDE